MVEVVCDLGNTIDIIQVVYDNFSSTYIIGSDFHLTGHGGLHIQPQVHM